MSQQDGTPSSTKQRRSRKTSTANRQHSKQVPAAQRPANDDTEAWKAYWKSQDHHWRTEPEIDTERQKYLYERRAMTPNIEQGIYPFKDIKLSRADVEWLLATHEHGRRPVNLDEENKKNLTGLDLRGADLCQVNLHKLPLTSVQGGLNKKEWLKANEEQRANAALHMEEADLSEVQLREANLRGAKLEGIDLSEAHLEDADLSDAHLEGARLWNAYLKNACLREAHLEDADLSDAHLEGADLSGAQLEEADLSSAQLQKAKLNKAQLRGAFLSYAQLEKAKLLQANLEGAELYRTQLNGAWLVASQLKGAGLIEAQLADADLSSAQLEGASLIYAQLSDAKLSDAQLEGADLRGAQLEGAFLSNAQLKGADLSAARLKGADLSAAQIIGADLSYAQLEGANLSNAQIIEANLSGAQLEKVNLRNIILGNSHRIGPRLADVQWGNTNLAIVDWSQVRILGDEFEAQQKEDQGKKKSRAKRLDGYESAVRANRQLAVNLRDQGLNEYADRFAYRAQVLQQRVLWLQIEQWKWIKQLKGLVQQSRVWKLLSELWQKVQQSDAWKQLEKPGQWIHTVWVRILKWLAFVFAIFLNVIAGYGYKPGRTLFWYLFTIVGFAIAYAVFGHLHPFPDALVFSTLSFHGRGFFPSLADETSLHNPLVMLAALEAVIGLLIEISFIATFTQRFFGK